MKDTHAAATGATLLSVLLIVLLRTAWICDDAFISFRTIDNFVNGFGLRWNVVERVQAFTHPLWVMLITPLYAVTREFYYTVVALSVTLTLATVWLMIRSWAENFISVVACTMLILVSKAFVDFSTSGLENPLSNLLIVLFFIAYYRSTAERTSLLWPTLLSALLVLNRSDLAVLVAFPMTYLIWRRGVSRAWKEVLPGAIPPVVWFAFALVYYGTPFPNTYYAKLTTGIATSELMSQGLSFFVDSLDRDPVTLSVIVLSLVVVFTRKQKEEWAIAAGLTAYLLYIVRIGGDFMSGRFFVVPFLVALHFILRSGLSWRQPTAVAVGLLVALGLFSPYTPLKSMHDYGAHGEGSFLRNGVADERAWYFQQMGLLLSSRQHAMPDHDWLDVGHTHTLEGRKVVQSFTVGMLGMGAGPSVYILDVCALGDPLLARLPVMEPHDWRIGHFRRRVPLGYFESLAEGDNRIKDTLLAEYYDKLCVITRGNIWDWHRLETIARMNFGLYDDLLANQTRDSLVTTSLKELGDVKQKGSRWDALGNTRFYWSGLQIPFDSVSHVDSWECALDHNDGCDFCFYRGDSLLGVVEMPVKLIPECGLRIDTVAVWPLVQQTGYDRIFVKPQSGDGLFSLGYLRPLVRSEGPI